jgi:hypothetical protein
LIFEAHISHFIVFFSFSQMQLTVTISNWTFCNRGEQGCEENGDYLEAALGVGSVSEALSRLNLEGFSWGPGAALIVVNNVTVDDDSQAMQPGYPALDNDNRLVVAIPRFSNSSTLSILLM